MLCSISEPPPRNSDQTLQKTRRRPEQQPTPPPPKQKLQDQTPGAPPLTYNTFAVYSANPILGDLAWRIYTTETFDEDLGAIALAHTAAADHGDLTLETTAEDHGPLYL